MAAILIIALAAWTVVAGCGNGNGGGSGGTCTTACADPNWAQWPMPNASPDVAAGAPNPMAYAVNGDGTVTDQVTGLTWQQAAPPDMTTWADAVAYCPTLTLGGHDGWRLPTEIELLSLDESLAAGPTINASAFPGTLPGYYWASLPMAGSPDDAWLVDFNSGNAYAAAKTALLYVRCVRVAAPAATGGARYTISGGLVHDTRTKLTWQQSVPTTRYSSGDARAYCASADVVAALGGTGWRLPTKKELLTLIDYSVAPAGPTVDATAFPGTPGDTFWSMTAVADPQVAGVWYVDFANGHAINYAVSPTSYVRCVR